MSTLVEVSRFSEEEAREYLERVLWRNSLACPHCGTVGNAVKLAGSATRPGVYKCREKACRKQLTVWVNTIFERSRVPPRTWEMAFSILVSAKKFVSAAQLQRELGLGSYQSAWHMCHRIRRATAKEPLSGMLSSQIEIDETYVRGEPRNGAGELSKTGRGSKKVPVMVLVERNGRARAMPIGRVNTKALKGAIREHVDRNSMIVTDEWAACKG
jgi:hypothetical protein